MMTTNITPEQETKDLLNKMNEPFEHKNYFFKVHGRPVGKLLLKMIRIVGWNEIRPALSELLKIEKNLKDGNITDTEVLEELEKNKELQNAVVSELLMKRMEDYFDEYIAFMDYSTDGGATYSPFVVKGMVQVEDLLADPVFLQRVALAMFKACAFFTLQSQK